MSDVYVYTRIQVYTYTRGLHVFASESQMTRMTQRNADKIPTSTFIAADELVLSNTLLARGLYPRFSALSVSSAILKQIRVIRVIRDSERMSCDQTRCRVSSLYPTYALGLTRCRRSLMLAPTDKTPREVGHVGGRLCSLRPTRHTRGWTCRRSQTRSDLQDTTRGWTCRRSQTRSDLQDATRGWTCRRSQTRSDLQDTTRGDVSEVANARSDLQEAASCPFLCGDASSLFFGVQHLPVLYTIQLACILLNARNKRSL